MFSLYSTHTHTKVRVWAGDRSHLCKKRFTFFRSYWRLCAIMKNFRLCKVISLRRRWHFTSVLISWILILLHPFFWASNSNKSLLSPYRFYIHIGSTQLELSNHEAITIFKTCLLQSHDERIGAYAHTVAIGRKIIIINCKYTHPKNSTCTLPTQVVINWIARACIGKKIKIKKTKKNNMWRWLSSICRR